MSLITRMRKQNAIYWPPATVDDFGYPTFNRLVALTATGSINSCVRWEGSVQEFLGVDGTMCASNAVVYVPALPDGSEIAVGGYLWLGDRMDLEDEATPTNNVGAYEIKRVDKLPTLKATEFLRTVYL